MANFERPLSPFMIYRPQLTSVLSILHRLTGVGLTLGTLLLVSWLLALASGPRAYAAIAEFLSGWAGITVLVGVSAAFFYHLSNGIRHLFWDSGRGLELKQAYATGWTVVAATAVLTLGLWLVIAGGRG